MQDLIVINITETFPKSFAFTFFLFLPTKKSEKANDYRKMYVQLAVFNLALFLGHKMFFFNNKHYPSYFKPYFCN